MHPQITLLLTDVLKNIFLKRQQIKVMTAVPYIHIAVHKYL